jgi:uncharacterized protein YodC (DUF2158 family)
MPQGIKPASGLAGHQSKRVFCCAGVEQKMPSKIQWKPGDKVQLISGGPEMTVQIQGTKGSTTAGVPPELVLCLWFDRDEKLQQGEFAPESLEIVK